MVVICLDCRLSVEGAAQASGQSATEDLHQTPVIRLAVLFMHLLLKRGFNLGL
jgi:hypothetical protein